MDYPREDGSTERSHRRQLAKSTQVSPSFDDDSIDQGYVFLWDTFWELYTPEGISFSELSAWQYLTNIELTGEERKILMVLASVARGKVDYMREKYRPKPKKSK